MPPPRERSWIPYVGFAITLAGIIWQGGVLSAQVTQNAGRITKLEVTEDARTQSLEEIRLRGATNEAKLNFLVEQAKDERTDRNSRR